VLNTFLNFDLTREQKKLKEPVQMTITNQIQRITETEK
jgi:hypothetical protein